MVPLIGLGAVALTVYALATSPINETQGVLGTAELMYASAGVQAVQTAGVISLAIAVFNTLPLFPLDGGRIIDAALSRTAGHRVAGGYRGATGVVMAGFLVWVLFTDVWSVVA